MFNQVRIHFENGIFTVGCFYDVPGSIIGAGLFDKLIDDREIGVVIMMKIPDARCYQPCGKRISLPFEKSQFLFLFADM